MWRNALHHVFGPLAYAWVDSGVRKYGDLAFPHDVPISHGWGTDPYRVLVIGGPVVQGIGVASYDLALSGHLARQLATKTGRGVDVESRGSEHFDSFTAARVLRSEDLRRFDAVLLMLGSREAVSLRSSRQWKADLHRLLGVIAEVTPNGPPVMIAGLTSFADDLELPGPVRRLLAKRVQRQNLETEEACNASGAATYVRFAPARAGIEYGRDAAAVYESWATALVPPMMSALDRTESIRASQAETVEEGARQRALDDLEVDAKRNPKLDRLVEAARDMLEMDAASINFIDHGLQWTKASVGVDSPTMPRGDAICNTTIETTGVYVVEDLDEEPRLRTSRWTAPTHHVRFYAGYPLEAPGGARVGALCVMDRRPHTFSAGESATLRDLALSVQKVLWERWA
ncbi:MAG: GAF domain-containing protein [Pseudolysinimonas sp.]